MHTYLIIIALTAFVGMWVASGSAIKSIITIVQCVAILSVGWLINTIATI